MYYYISDKKEEIYSLAEWLEIIGYEDSKITHKENAIGICTTTDASGEYGSDVYTYLVGGGMVGTNPHVSWTMYRTFCKTSGELKRLVLEKKMRGE